MIIVTITIKFIQSLRHEHPIVYSIWPTRFERWFIAQNVFLTLWLPECSHYCLPFVSQAWKYCWPGEKRSLS